MKKVSLATNSLAAVAPQITALILLPAEDYGRFAILYLIYAFGVSVCLSSVSEAWSRAGAHQPPPASWQDHSATLVWLATFVGLCAGGVGLLLGLPALGSIVAMLAVSAAIVRVGVRYYEATRGELIQRSVLADVVGLLVLLAGALLGVVAGLERTETQVLMIWAGSVLVATLVGCRVHLRSWRVLQRWWGRHRAEIKALQGESLLMDLGAFGTPLLLLTMLSVAEFGLFRGLSSVAAPVRMILNPMRPHLAQRGPQGEDGPVAFRTLILAGAGLGVLTWAGLHLIDLWDLPLGTLRGVSRFAELASLYVMANLVGHYCYIYCRTRAPGGAILRQRLIQTAIVGGLPLGGACWVGLPGAVAGIALGASLSATGWMRLASRTGAAGTQGQVDENRADET